MSRRAKKIRIPAVKPGDTVPSTGLYHVPKNTRIIPKRKPSARSRKRT